MFPVRHFKTAMIINLGPPLAFYLDYIYFNWITICFCQFLHEDNRNRQEKNEENKKEFNQIYTFLVIFKTVFKCIFINAKQFIDFLKIYMLMITKFENVK